MSATKRAGRAPSDATKFDKEFEQVRASQARYERRGGSGPEGPMAQFLAKERIKELRVQYEAGDRMALLAAIRRCANHGLVMPEWVAKEFIRGYDSVLNCREKSWDAAFGAPYPKNSNLRAMRRRRTLRLSVYNAVNDLHRRDPKEYPIDGITFAVIGKRKQFNMSGSAIGKLYYETKHLMQRVSGTAD